MLRSLNVIIELYYLPLKSRHIPPNQKGGQTILNARIPPGATVPFVVEIDIAAMFAAVEPLIDYTSNLIFQLDETLDVSLNFFLFYDYP